MNEELKKLKLKAISIALIEAITVIMFFLLGMLVMSSCSSTRYPTISYSGTVVQKLASDTTVNNRIIYNYKVKGINYEGYQHIGWFGKDNYNIGDTVTYTQKYIPTY